jgi:hypothetical protein
MRRSGRGDRSQKTAPAGGRSSTDVTVVRVTISPPRDRKYAARAFARLCAPPRGKHHPATCAATLSASAMPPVGRISKGIMLCAAIPPNSARAGSPVKTRRARLAAGCSARIPKRASAMG